MSQYGNLSHEDQAKVDRKLAELQKTTGLSWECEVTQLPQANDRHPLLEITINDRIVKPIALESDQADPADPKSDRPNPADRICAELEKFSVKEKSLLTHLGR